MVAEEPVLPEVPKERLPSKFAEQEVDLSS